MALFDRVRALWTPLTAPSLEVEVRGNDAPQAVHTARDIDPNNLRGGGGRGDSFYQSASALVNMFTGQGSSRDPTSFNVWATPRCLNERERFGMGRNGLIQQALGKLPNTATREGWTVEILDDEIEDRQDKSDKIHAYEQRLGLQQRINRALFRSRQYSKALVILGIDDERPMSEPVNVDAIQTIRWAVTIDSRDFDVHKLADSTSENYGGVEQFQVTDVNGILEDGLRYGDDSISYTATQWEEVYAREAENSGQLIVHASRVLYFHTPDFFSLLDSLQDSLGAYFETMGGIRTGARESSMLKYKLSKLKQKMWSKNENLAREHMSLVQRAKSVLNAFVMDADEDVDFISRPLAGLSDLANPVMAWVAAALSIPNTVFWQVSPGGFGKGEAERETWHEDVRAYQQLALSSELTKVHGYIMVAQDGLRLPQDTKRKIVYNDLTPPDEVQKSALRSEALSDLRQLAKDDLITRVEARSALQGLNDEYFRLELDTEFADIPSTAAVGIFTGTIEALTAFYGEGAIPPEAIRAVLVALDPSHFNTTNTAEIFVGKTTVPPIDGVPGAPEGGSADPLSPMPEGGVEPGDEEDVETEPSEVEIAWTEAEAPAGAETAKSLAADPSLGATSRQIKQLAREGKLKAHKPRGFTREPLFLLEEVKRSLLERQGQLEAAVEEESTATEVADISPSSLCIMLRLSPELARWVPYKENDSSPPHITLVYAKNVKADELPGLLEELHAAFATFDPFEVSVHGDPVHYFDTPNDGRVAVAQASFDEQDLVFEELAQLIEDYGSGGKVSRFENGYAPHVTLAYLPDGERDYVGPKPEGSWLAASAHVSYGGEEVAVFEFEGEDVVDDSFEVDDDLKARDKSSASQPDEDTIKLWLAEHISDARKMPRNRMQVLKGLESKYDYLAPPEVSTVYRGLRNVQLTKAGKLLGLSNAVVDKSWTTDLSIAAKFASTEWTSEEPDENRVGAVLVADADPSKLLLNYALLAELPGVADRYHDRWDETLKQAILDEKEVLALSPLNVRTVKIVPMHDLPGDGEARLVHDAVQVAQLITHVEAQDKAPLIKAGYIWRTQKDSKVRPAHEKLEGRRFKTGDKHKTEGEPGERPNCRCAKEIIVPPKGTKRSRAVAQRTTKRALKLRFEKVTGAAIKRAQSKITGVKL